MAPGLTNKSPWVISANKNTLHSSTLRSVFHLRAVGGGYTVNEPSLIKNTDCREEKKKKKKRNTKFVSEFDRAYYFLFLSTSFYIPPALRAYHGISLRASFPISPFFLTITYGSLWQRHWTSYRLYCFVLCGSQSVVWRWPLAISADHQQSHLLQTAVCSVIRGLSRLCVLHTGWSKPVGVQRVFA